MFRKRKVPISIIGAAAGAVNGMLGAGGGMILVPLLSSSPNLDDQEIFPASVAIILPVCIVSLLLSPTNAAIARQALPYLLGSTVGGVLVGLLGKRIPALWLHRFLGVLILWGGIRYLC